MARESLLDSFDWIGACLHGDDAGRRGLYRVGWSVVGRMATLKSA